MLRLEDTASFVLQCMEDYEVQHLPLLKDEYFIGLVSKESVLDIAVDQTLATIAENLLRIACGAFMFPHALSKFATFGVLSAGTIGFFGKAGFQPPELWAWLAAFTEAACGIALVLGHNLTLRSWPGAGSTPQSAAGGRLPSLSCSSCTSMPNLMKEP